jgi:hypothetical protein
MWEPAPKPKVARSADRKVGGAVMTDRALSCADCVAAAVGDCLLRPLVDLIAVYASTRLRITFSTLREGYVRSSLARSHAPATDLTTPSAP